MGKAPPLLFNWKWTPKAIPALIFFVIYLWLSEYLYFKSTGVIFSSWTILLLFVMIRFHAVFENANVLKFFRIALLAIAAVGFLFWWNVVFIAPPVILYILLSHMRLNRLKWEDYQYLELMRLFTIWLVLASAFWPLVPIIFLCLYFGKFYIRYDNVDDIIGSWFYWTLVAIFVIMIL